MKVQKKFIKIESDVNGLVMADYIDNAQIWTGNTVTASETLEKVNADSLPDLPKEGWVNKGLYKHNEEAVFCNTSHNRTIYEPKETPALFSVSRNNSDELRQLAGNS